MESSYIKNDYGDVLFRNVVYSKPRTAVELGVLHGYSTLHIAKGLMVLNEFSDNFWGLLNAYDLFEDYPYKHGDRYLVESMLKKNNVFCVINIPTLELADKVVGSGNSSGRKVDKFKAFGLTSAPASTVVLNRE